MAIARTPRGRTSSSSSTREVWLTEADTRAGARDAAGREALLRYVLRPPEIHGFLKQHGVYLECTLDDLEQDTANSRLVTR